MRTAILVAALGLIACGASVTEPEPDDDAAECEPLPWCKAWKDDTVTEPGYPQPLPDSLFADSLGH